MYLVPPQGVRLNTNFAAANIRDPPGTKQMITGRKRGRFRWEVGSYLFRRFSSVVSSSKGRPRIPAHDTAQHDYETTTPSLAHSAITPERIHLQDSTSSHRRRDDRNDLPRSSGSSQEMGPHPYRSRRTVSPQLHRSMSTDTTFAQGPRSHSSGRITRTSSIDHELQPTGTQIESGLNSRGVQMLAKRQERRSRFPSTLLSLLSNDFRCVLRYRAVTHNTNYCTIIHRFRVLVVGKVCIMYHTGRRRY